MRRLFSIIKLLGFIKFLLPKRKTAIKLLPLINPKRAGKIAYHAGKIRLRNEFKRFIF